MIEKPPEVSPDQGGLTREEAHKRLATYGPNVIVEKRRTPLFLQFLKQFQDLLVIVLIAAAGFSFAAGEGTDGLIIVVILILNATIGFFQEFKAERAVEALKRMLAQKARVLRDGAESLIDARELVPGDVMILAEGDRVSADAQLIEENEIQINESILTGESLPVLKDTTKNNRIFMGTQVTHGTGRAIVTQTGMRTEFGRIATLTSETKKDLSPLQQELQALGIIVTKITLGLCFVLFVIGIAVQGRGLIETLLFAVSVAVAAVPEGLPATITVALAIGVQRLARENAIVKQLSSVETLGSTTVICSDKTGTLTKNEMTVQELALDDYEVEVRGVGYAPEGSFAVHRYPAERAQPPEYFEFEKEDWPEAAGRHPDFSAHAELALRAMMLCNNAKLVRKDDESWEALGDPTEAALLTLGEKAGISLRDEVARHTRLCEIPFDSRRKRMTVIAREAASGKIFAYGKGAPDSLLPLCATMLEGTRVVPLTEEKRKKFLGRSEIMAKRALRTIAVAYRELGADPGKKPSAEETERNLVFLGITGMMDPPREEVKEAVKLTRKAGIRVFIITGDHGLTAHAVAQEIGLTKAYGVHIVTGDLLEKISDEKLADFLAPGEETIFARVSPEHKLRIVSALKKAGEIVAVTGDGVNDAPALKRADIGVAMGITGTDVSKEAANMVLLDDSFRTIVAAVIQGRTIYENMKKFIFYIFSSNIGELSAIFATILLGLPAPLSAALILIINTLTDVFPALALGVEPVERNVLEKPPRNKNRRIIEWRFLKHCLASGLMIGAMSGGAFIANLWRGGWRLGETVPTESHLYAQSVTMAFVVLTLAQMFQAINSRSSEVSVFRMNFFGNLSLLGAIVFSTLGTVLVVQLPFFEGFLKTVPLTLVEWFTLATLSSLILFFEEIWKFFVRKNLSARTSS